MTFTQIFLQKYDQDQSVSIDILIKLAERLQKRVTSLNIKEIFENVEETNTSYFIQDKKIIDKIKLFENEITVEMLLDAYEILNVVNEEKIKLKLNDNFF